MFVVNPLTNKPIKVFGRTYRKLVEEGLIECPQTHPDVLCNESDKTTVDEFNREFYRSGEPYQAVKGRGFFEGKAVIRRLPRNWPPPEDEEGEEEDEEEGEGEEEEEEGGEEEFVYE